MVLLRSCAFPPPFGVMPSLPSPSQGGGESRYQVIDPGRFLKHETSFFLPNKGSLFVGNGNMKIPAYFGEIVGWLVSGKLLVGWFPGNCLLVGWLVGFREIVGWLVGFREIVGEIFRKKARLVKLWIHLARLVGVLEILLMATRNPAWKPVEVGSISHYLHGFLDPRWSPEFFH